MTSKDKLKTILKVIPYFIIGFCLMWIIYANDYEKTYQALASNLLTDSAQRIQFDNENSARKLAENIKDLNIIYCDIDEKSNLKGIKSGKKAVFPIPIVEGRFFSQEEFEQDTPVAVVGKGIKDDLIIIDNKTYIKINNKEFEVIGIMGLSGISSVADYSILITIGNALEVFDYNYEPIYSIDGNYKGIQDTINSLKEQNVSFLEIPRKAMGLNNIYSVDYSPSVIYISFFVVIVLLLILFVFLETFNRKQELYIYKINGASKIQIIFLLFKKHMLVKYLGLVLGMLATLFFLNTTLKISFSAFSFLYAVLISLFAMIFAITILTLSFLNEEKNKDTVNKTSSFSKIIFAFVVITASMTLIFTNIVIVSYEKKDSAHSLLTDSVNKSYFTVYTGMTDQEFDAAIHKPDFLKKVKYAHSMMGNNPTYKFYDFVGQFILLENTTLPDAFYEDENQISSIQVSKNFFDVFKLKLSAGNFFDDKDYFADDKNKIPVILGHEYGNIYSIGDTIHNANYLFKNYQLIVIGIMEKDNYYIRQGNVESTNYLIIMPSIKYRNEPIPYSDEWMHQIALYTQKLCGVYVLDSKNQFTGLSAWLQSVIKESGIYQLHFLDYPETSAAFLQSISKEYINTTITLLIALFILLFSLFAQISYYIFESKRYYYEVLKICGASIFQISLDVCRQILSLGIASNIFALIITSLFISINYTVLVFAISISAVILISSIYIWFILKKEYIG